MSSPVLALRRAILAALAADAPLRALLDGAHVYDEAPPGAPTPRIAFADAQSRDWSAQSSHGAEQILVLTVWSGARGTREALDIADRVVALLDEAALTLVGHRLIDLRFVALATKREQNGRYARADIRFRATTEAN
ncbi:MAG TPA: DUF3168 domain-containing protein [Rhodoblastus sp.]|mgnify:CR=1 FL=1|nr:DUF3168 domain-containing protein [Rhodoblastus sp.]